MKKLVYLCMMLVGVLAVSCEKDEIGGTSTEAVAGEWYVTVTCVDESGNTVYEDDEFFGLGRFLLNTYNTAANDGKQIWVDDRGNFWDFKVKADCDVAALTFSTGGMVADESSDFNVNIEDGKIMYGAATNPHGTAADSIVFYVTFSDDTYPATYGFSKYKISGYRYTGFVSDDE